MSSTTDPSLRSFLPVEPSSHFPIQNLPVGVFRRRGENHAHIGTAIGSSIVDLTLLERHGLLPGSLWGAFQETSLNRFLSLGRPAWTEFRSALSKLLQHDTPTLRDDEVRRQQVILPMEWAEMLLPVVIGDYTDFYSSREHATNVGTMLRGPENALMPNWLHLPVAYHGRTSSIVISGTKIHRPMGQTKSETSPAPTFGPSKAVDFELEMGYFVGPGNPLGEPIPIDEALDHIFGMVLVNDWSARDVQKWEYVPLGPFLAKNFATTISPWIVSLEALEPFRTNGPIQDPAPLPYLHSGGNPTYDIRLEVALQAAKMNDPLCITSSNLKHLYWNIAQQVAHHTCNGCNLRSGDLLATGTISGPEKAARGSMLELTWGGKEPIELPGGEQRRFLEDGDTLTISGWCEGAGYCVGFGAASGTILAGLS